LRTLAIIVNYKSSSLTLEAVRSVLSSESLGPVQTVVVDNSEDRTQAELLRSNLSPSVRLIVNDENMGFGRACNMAFSAFSGECVLLINPDARLLPGCLLRLQRTLSAGDVGAVAPQIFWDDHLHFYLPPSYPPFLLFWGADLSKGPGGNRAAKALSLFWRRHARRVWCSREPVRVNNLSGGLVLLKREAVEKAGGLFDPIFFLYFEDMDLFVRLRKAGYTLITEPRARAVHYYNQCGREDPEWKRGLMAASQRLFLEKHAKRSVWRVKRVIRALGPHSSPGELYPSKSPESISPFVIKIPRSVQDGWLFELSPNPDFIPAIGHFGKGPHVALPSGWEERLAPGRYFCRVGRSRGFGWDAQVASWTI
jgi:GT2 family glycosyltransferase